METRMSDMAARGRRLIARRTGWPAGALAECEQLDTEHPGWSFCWMPENRSRGWERPAGFAACRPGVSLRGADELRRGPQDGVERMPWCFGPDVATLRQKIAGVDARIAAEQEAEERLWASIRRGIGAR
jgi:hypothetical protein